MYRNLIVLALFMLPAWTMADPCVECHQHTSPGIVQDWKSSTHDDNGVACIACHGAEHLKADDSAKATMPTAQTCGNCHQQRFDEFSRGKHAFAWAAMQAMPTTHALPVSLTAGMKGCGGCHKLGLKSEEEVKALEAHGGGYGNASCDACHTRHSFSVEEARQPQACRTCHMGFDHPQWEMYESSKHGVRNDLKQVGKLS
ncbi:MAG: multiheme c-type cytochrome, partial [Pseudomonadota bacterium]